MSIFPFVLVVLFGLSMAQLQAGVPDEKEKTTALKDLLSRIDLDELMKKDEPPLEFPDTLEGFEYAFNENGQLRHIKTGEPFVFNYREDLHRWNQKRYEALGEIITKHVYELLEKDCNLQKVYLPIDATENEPKSFIFMSKDAMTNPDKMLVLIHGSGVVRAGQWARRLIINEDINSGTQIPYIKRAMKEGYAVIVLNPNENYIEVEKSKQLAQQQSPDSSDEPAEKRERRERIPKDNKKKRDFYEKYRNPQKEKETLQLYIRENGSPEEHALYVWDNFISKAAAEHVFFVAHSYGGLAFVELEDLSQEEAVECGSQEEAGISGSQEEAGLSVSQEKPGTSRSLTESQVPPLRLPYKRARKATPSPVQDSAYRLIQEALASLRAFPSPEEAFACMAATKLQGMQEGQRKISEDLIYKVLRKGESGELTPKTDVIEMDHPPPPPPPAATTPPPQPKAGRKRGRKTKE
ncbi:cotranscriptional regulator ARB2A isoform X1 [Aquarana catesbeiana]|uniref:cotranscriptional regulator ARB2A isoform X1 n=1 Tax=Aquarana catesbeiana TaxID=8400 RepID=UPI003CC9E5D8